MRIASHSIAEVMKRSVAANQAELNAEQVRIASGNKHQARSEDCASTARAAEMQQAQAVSSQFQSNIQQVSTWTSITESRLISIVDQMARAREIAVEANDASLSDGARKALVTELDGLLEDMLSQANASFDGMPVFGGLSGAQPVLETRDAAGRITGVAYAAGTDSARSVQVGENATVSCGVSAAGPAGAFADSTSGRDLFQSLIDLRDEAGANGSVSSATLTDLADAFDGATQALVQTGIQTNRLHTIEQQGQSMDVTRQQSLSDLTDTDMAAAISRLSELEASLQASMQLAVAVGRLSLADYI